MNLSRAVLFAGGRRGHQHGRGGLLLPSPPSLLSRRHGNTALAACCCSSRPSPSSSSFPAVHGLGGDSGEAGSTTTSPEDHAGGIGVAEFLGAKNFLITGATGFLAKGDTYRHVPSDRIL